MCFHGLMVSSLIKNSLCEINYHEVNHVSYCVVTQFTHDALQGFNTIVSHKMASTDVNLLFSTLLALY